MNIVSNEKTLAFFKPGLLLVAAFFVLASPLFADEATSILGVHDMDTDTINPIIIIVDPDITPYKRTIKTASALGTAPEVDEIKINNKVFFDGDFINGNKTDMAITITNTRSNDDPGIAAAEYALLDGTTVIATNNVTFPGVTKNITVTGNFGSLAAGTYTLRINAVSKTDVAMPTENHTIKVADGLEISDALTGPNPFNPNQETATVQYNLSRDARVKFMVYSISGVQLYATEQNGTAGFNTLTWNGTNNWNEIVANGVVVGYLVANDGLDKKVKTLKIAVMK